MSDGQMWENPWGVQLNEAEVERRKRFVGFIDEDVAKLLTVKDVILARRDDVVRAFFDYLSRFDEAGGLLRNPGALETARRLKRDHVTELVGGDYGAGYAEKRYALGMLYSKAGLDMRIFLGAFQDMIAAMSRIIMESGNSQPAKAFAALQSLNKIAFLDLGIVLDVLVAERERTISIQQEAIRELSTPVLQVRERLLILPIIGMIDTQRTKQLTDNLLHAIRANRAKVAVMDITGVAAVDSKVANHLIQTVDAAKLMGTIVIITGLSPDVAQAMVTLGVDISKLNTVGDLQGGIEEAERILGLKVVPKDTPLSARTP
jgi:rsbT co-antagonist protein RsbR